MRLSGFWGHLRQARSPLSASTTYATAASRAVAFTTRATAGGGTAPAGALARSRAAPRSEAALANGAALAALSCLASIWRLAAGPASAGPASLGLATPGTPTSREHDRIAIPQCRRARRHDAISIRHAVENLSPGIAFDPRRNRTKLRDVVDREVDASRPVDVDH